MSKLKLAHPLLSLYLVHVIIGGGSALLNDASSAASPSSSSLSSPASSEAADTSIPSVNYTLIDQEFQAAVASNDELARKWKSMDSSMKTGIQAAVKVIFPRVVAMASEARVSGDCSGAMLKLMLSLRSLKSWAVKMIDSMGKPNAGVLSGSLTMFGDYGQCLSVRAPDEDEIEIAGGFVEYFRGKYCVLEIKPKLTERPQFYTVNSTISALRRRQSLIQAHERTLYDDLSELAMGFHYASIRVDMCVPSLCSRDDIQRVASYIGNVTDMRTRVLRCETEPPSGAMPVAIDKARLLWAFVAAFVIVIIALIRVLSTTKLSSDNNNNNNNSDSNSSGIDKNGKYPANQIIEPLTSSSKANPTASVSSAQNIKDLRNETTNIDDSEDSNDRNDDDDDDNHDDNDKNHANVERQSRRILKGLMGIILMWVIFVHTLSSLPYQFLRHLLPLREHMLAYGSLVIVNSTLQFDLLLLVAAFTFAYTHARSPLAKLLAHTAITYVRRLIPMILLIVIVIWTSGLSGHWHQSPVWGDLIEPSGQACLSNGIFNLLFVQNYLSANADVCLPHTWLLAVELQLLMLVGIPFVYYMTIDSTAASQDVNNTKVQQQSASNPNKNQLVSLSLLALGSIVSGVHVYTYGLPPVWLYTFPDLNDRRLYIWAHLGSALTHLVPFVIGLRAGHSTYHRQQLNSQLSSRDRKQNGPIRQRGRPFGRTLYLVLMRTRGILIRNLCIAILVYGIWSPNQWLWATGADNLPGSMISAVYDMTIRLSWSLAASWLLICFIKSQKQQKHCKNCITHPLFLAFGRRWALIYLIYPWVHALVMGTQQQASFSSPMMLIYVLIGNCLLSLVIAKILHSHVDRPLRLACRHFMNAKSSLKRNRQTVSDVEAV